MEMAEAFIFDAGWLFFASWAVVLVTVSVVAFGWDVLQIVQHETGSTIKQINR
jgi:hypothetical protein